MTDIGDFTLTLSFFVAAFGFVAYLLGARQKNQQLLASARNSQHLLTVLLTIAIAAVVYGFVTRNFSIEYVASYSSSDMSIFYTVAALWGGQKGSLLLWVWLLAIFGSIVIWQNRAKNLELMPYVGAVISGTALFFLTLMVFSTPVFERLIPPVEEGRGLNPLLRNADMVTHPITLYLGFVGFTVPFAFALAALITGKLDDEWLRSTRRWTIFSWFFLMLGNLFGAQWAYVELGWGGFWAWDPVENASFMPWLTGTAYLHSVMIQEKRGMLKVWNMVLIILTFFLTIFGTFVTRSGIVSSVHSFGQSTLGPFFFGFMGVSLFISFYFMFLRLPSLKGRHELDAIISRESSFLVNNLLLVGITFAVFWGTVFPFISEAVRGVKITVGPPFFNKVAAPLGLAVLLVTGICPLISWHKATGKNLFQNFLYPFFVAALASMVLFAAGIRSGYALMAFSLSLFVVATIALEFIRGAAARHRMTGEGRLPAFFNMIRRNKRRYGGYVIHFGVILMALGITGAMVFKTEKEASLQVGQSVSINQYRLTYEGMSRWQARDRFVVAANLAVYDGSKKIGTMVPEKAFYPQEEQPLSEVAIRPTMKEDLYAILAGWDDKGTAHFKFLVNPLVIWLWIGGAVMSLGTIIVMWPDRKIKRREE